VIWSNATFLERRSETGHEFHGTPRPAVLVVRRAASLDLWGFGVGDRFVDAVQRAGDLVLATWPWLLGLKGADADVERGLVGAATCRSPSPELGPLTARWQEGPRHHLKIAT